MSLSYSHGAVQWLAADAVNVEYAVTGLGFVPKALRFVAMGLGSATDTNSTTTHIRRSMGFATAANDRRCIASQDQDNQADATCTTGVRNDAVIATLTATGPAADGLLDLKSIDADGFTLIVDDATPVNLTVFWEAWGGADLETAQTLEFSEPAATGSQTYSCTGLVSTDTGHQVVLFGGINQTGTTPSVGRANSGFMMGAASGASTAQIVMVGSNVDAAATMESHRYNQTGECVALMTAGNNSDNPTARAAFTAFTDGGFTLNWIARATTGRKYIAMGIKGGSWTAGSTTLARGTLNNTATISGLAYAPVGVQVYYTSMTELTAGSGQVGDYLSYGVGTSTTSRRCMSSYLEDSNVTSSAELDIEYDQIGVQYFSGSLDMTIDLSQMNSDGFQLIVDDASAFAATVWVGYLTFGNGIAAQAAVARQSVKPKYHRFSFGG